MKEKILDKDKSVRLKEGNIGHMNPDLKSKMWGWEVSISKQDSRRSREPEFEKFRAIDLRKEKK